LTPSGIGKFLYYDDERLGDISPVIASIFFGFGQILVIRYDLMAYDAVNPNYFEKSLHFVVLF